MMDANQDPNKVRKHIAAVKAMLPQVLHDIASRALHLHGSLGISTAMLFADWVINSFHVGRADGPTDFHKITVAREVLKDYRPSTSLFPGYHSVATTARAWEWYGDQLAA